MLTLLTQLLLAEAYLRQQSRQPSPTSSTFAANRFGTDDGPFSNEQDQMVNPFSADKPFPFLDNMVPVAPEDSVGNGPVGVGGVAEDALAVPPYAIADPFPQGHRLYGVRKDEALGWQSGIPTVEPPVIVGKDPSFGSGDYWHPAELAKGGGLVAPASKMPLANYPLMAKGDDFSPKPAVGPEDALPRKYARYFDQVEDLARGCTTQNGYVEGACTVACAINETVQGVFGNEILTVMLRGIDTDKDIAQVTWAEAEAPAPNGFGSQFANLAETLGAKDTGPVTLERRLLLKCSKTDGSDLEYDTDRAGVRGQQYSEYKSCKVCAPDPAFAGVAGAALLATGAS